MASGKSLLLRAIHRPAPLVVHRHVGAPRRVRRNRRLRTAWTGAFVTNVPYVDPARDERDGRKLRGATDG